MSTIINNEFAAQLISTLKNADEAYITEVRQLLAVKEVKAKAEKEVKEVKVVKAVKAVKAVKEKAEVPVAVDGAPDASAYRVTAEGIDDSKCVGRITKDGVDKRWKPAVYRERQCGKEVTEDGLCKTCAARSEKYEGKAGPWMGRITEEPLEWVHMLGTEWADKKKPVFLGVDSSAPASVAENSGNESAGEMESVKSKPKTAKADKEAEKAEKATAKALKEAEKAAAKAAKEAEKEAAKAAKEAAKAEKAEKPKAAKATKAVKPKAEKAEKAKPKAAVEAKVVEQVPEKVSYEMEIINEVVYFTRNGNAYHSELDGEVGGYAGRVITKDDVKALDTEADEVNDVESESD